MTLANIALPPIELRPFEKEIINSYKVFNPVKGTGGKATSRKGVWIRGHLLAQREDYIYGMWDRWLRFTRIADVMEAKIEPGNYATFRYYVWRLKRHGLLTPTVTRAGRKAPLPEFWRQYYAVNPAMLNSPLWLNPWRGEESWERQRRRKFRPYPGAPRKKPAKPRGRPPKRA